MTEKLYNGMLNTKRTSLIITLISSSVMYPIFTTHQGSTVTVSTGRVGSNSFGGFFLKNFCNETFFFHIKFTNKSKNPLPYTGIIRAVS